MSISQKGVVITKTVYNTQNDQHDDDVNLVNGDEDERNMACSANIHDTHIAHVVKNELMTYEPQKTKHCPVELNIIMTDDIPVHQSSRRLPVVVPETMQVDIIHRAHEQGHFKGEKTAEVIRSEFYIPHLDNEMEQVIRNCVTCILAEKKCEKIECLRHPIPTGPGHDTH